MNTWKWVFFLRNEFPDNITLTTKWIWNFNKRRYHWYHQNPRTRISVHKSKSTKSDGAWWGSCLGLCACVLNYVRLFVTPWVVARQAPLSAGFARQEYWGGLPFPSLGDLPTPGIKPASPALQADCLLLSHLGSPFIHIMGTVNIRHKWLHKKTKPIRASLSESYNLNFVCPF